MTLTLAGSFLSFLRLNPDWQIGAQGAILILVLALRVLIDRAEARRVTALRALAASPGSGPGSARSRSGSASSLFTGGQGGGEVLTAALTFAAFYVLVALGQMFVDHPRPRQRRPVDPGLHDARRHRRDEGDGRGERR